MSENQRLKEVRTTLNLNQVEFAERLGLKQGSYSPLEKNQHINARIKKSLAFHYKLNTQWLETGDGYMFLDFKTIPGRIRFIMNEWNHNTRDMAYMTGIDELKIIRALKEETSFTNEELSIISGKYQRYNTMWLVTGNGDVYDNRIKQKSNGDNNIQLAGSNNQVKTQEVNNDFQLLKQENQALRSENELLRKLIKIYEQNKDS